MSKAPPLRTIPNFPRDGIHFIDITPWLHDGPGFAQAIAELAAFARACRADLIAAPEARGFIVGAPIATALGIGFVPVRKPGRLPAETCRADYQLEYGEASLELHRDAIAPGQRVLVVDDLLATGGTAAAVVRLVRELGGVVAGAGFLVELAFLAGRAQMGDIPVRALVAIKE